MTHDEFRKAFYRLMSVFGRVNEPADGVLVEWYKSLKIAKVDDFHKAIDMIRDEAELNSEFPSTPGVIWAKIRTIASKQKVWGSCPHCDKGMIRYSRQIGVNQKNQPLLYDFYAACDCESGDTVATRMISGWRRKGINVRVEQAARYSWLFQRFGGIDSAKNGFGVSSEKIPAEMVDENDDGAGHRPNDPTTLSAIFDDLDDLIPETKEGK